MRSTQIPLFTPETEWVMPEELKDLSDDSMSLVTTVYEILDVINLLDPSMMENTKVEGTFNTSS